MVALHAYPRMRVRAAFAATAAAGLVLTVVGIAIGVGGAVLAYGYGLGSLREPGPGLWPFIVSAVIATLSVLRWGCSFAFCGCVPRSWRRSRP